MHVLRTQIKIKYKKCTDHLLCILVLKHKTSYTHMILMLLINIHYLYFKQFETVNIIKEIYKVDCFLIDLRKI